MPSPAVPGALGHGADAPGARVSGRAPTVVVIGGGIAGLAAAWEIVSRPGPPASVVVLEQSDRLGGKLQTTSMGDRPVDVGPDAFVARRPEALGLCEELGLADDLVAPGAQGAAVWARGKLRPLPEGLALGIPTRLGPLARSGILDPSGLVRAAADVLDLRPRRGRRLADDSDCSVGAIVRARLGHQVADRLADPLIGGIHAGPIDGLSAAAVFPALLRAASASGSLLRALRSVAAPASGPGTSGTPGRDGAQGSGSPPVFLTVRGGMGRLVAVLAAALAARGVELRTGVTTTSLARRSGGWELRTSAGTIDADAVVVALPAPAAASALRCIAPEAAAALDQVTYASVSVVTAAFDEQCVGGPLAGTGFLVPAEQGLLMTGCTWLSAKWPQLRRPGEVLVRVSAGRAGDERAATMDDDTLVRRLLAELRAVAGITGDPADVLVTRWPAAFPQYAVGHVRRMTQVQASLAQLGAPVALAGAVVQGVGIPACIGSGRQAASMVLERLARVPAA